MNDIYLYEDVPVLKNKFGIKDEKTLDLVEAEQSRASMMLLYEHGFHDFSNRGVKKIHRTLFEDVYEWAGNYRVINIIKREPVLAGQSVWYSKAKIIKGDICEERGHRRLMRDEGETKLTPQEQSLNEEIEKLQDQWPYLMNEIFFIDYLKNPTYERGLAAKSKILVCFNDELLAAFLSAYKKANISEQQEMLTILKEISFRGGAVERDETDTEVTRKNLEKLENALNSEVEHTSDAVKKFYANRHLETVKQIRQKFLNTREM